VAVTLQKAGGNEISYPHEAWYHYIAKEGASDLCVICHSDLATGKAGHRHPTGHVPCVVPEALKKSGAQPNAGGTGLDCLVCHSTATSRFEPIVVGNSGPDGLCLACHPQQGSIFGSLHDIRSEPGPGASAGSVSSKTSGTCRTCHPAHRPARTPVPTRGDPDGSCTACHQPRGWAQSKCASSIPHPGTACGDCHNPHEARHGQFLSRPAHQLCIGCHRQQAGMAGGPHDPSRHPEAWPDQAAASQGICLACHVPHADQGTGLLRIQAAQGAAATSGDAACLACHADAAWGAKSDKAILHPRDIGSGRRKTDSGRESADAPEQQRMECRTCHDPHGGAKPGYLTRGAAEEPAGLCLGCHTHKREMKYTGHSMENLTRVGFEAGQCRPCHAMHADREQAWGQMLSPRFLVKSEGDATAVANPPDDGVACQVCHRAGGVARAPAVSTHPPIVVPNVTPPGSPGYLPLFDASGHARQDGQVTCRTCHLSHGRLDLVKLAAENRTLSEQDRRALRLNLRPFVTPNLCTQCHGQGGRLRFLLYHDPSRREKLTAGQSGAPPVRQ